LRDADRRLLRKAGVDTSGKVVFQFYSPETYQALFKLEAAAVAPRTISQLRRTVFGVHNTAGRYEFFVISQEYL
jgi:hypothetical protein